MKKGDITNPKLKGTYKIRAIIKKLQDIGYNIDYVEITNKPNDVVLEEISKCDILVAQLYADFPLTGIAREAACCGKPAIVGGYYADYINNDYNDFLPIYYCHPDQVEEKIIHLIENKEWRLSFGFKARDYMKKVYAPEIVANNYLLLLNNSFPDKWYYNPYDIEYFLGSGISEYDLKNRLFDIVSKLGVKGLHLSDKPSLEKTISKYLDGLYIS